MKHQVAVLFVCLGNICRSPTAERGIDLSTMRARQVTPADFLQFDFLLDLVEAAADGLLLKVRERLA